MTVEAGALDERVTGRVWIMRLAPYGRPAAGTVRLSRSRPACADQRFPNATAGRKAAIGHINGHLAGIRAGGGPRNQAWCACRISDCSWHTPEASSARPGSPRPTAGVKTVRCGGRWC